MTDFFCLTDPFSPIHCALNTHTGHFRRFDIKGLLIATVATSTAERDETQTLQI